jgi:hypothetical protein
MIELDERTDDDFVTLRFGGFQSAFEFASFADTVDRLRGGRERLRVLFDWTALKGWDANGAFAGSCRRWKEASLLIDRMAIVHEHHWNRQAALLAAVLRSDFRQVRSWVPRDFAKAVMWLRQA